TALDHNLLVRAQDVAALVDGTGATLASAAGARFVERGESYDELLTPVSRDVDATTAFGRTSLLSRAELERARRGSPYSDSPSVADAGHELRTPLALLRTELELALRHAESPQELREAVRRSSADVDRLGQLAEDLLLIARSDRGRLPLRLETVHAGELLGSVA